MEGSRNHDGDTDNYNHDDDNDGDDIVVQVRGNVWRGPTRRAGIIEQSLMENTQQV